MKQFAVCSALFAVLGVATSCVVSDEPVTETESEGPAAAAEVEVDLTQEVAVLATGSYSYSTSNTNSAQQNTFNKTVALTAGQQITLGSCGVAGSAFTGDTYLRLFGPSGTEVSYSDDGCGGLGSNLVYTVPTSGNYVIRGGCYSATACTATVAWSTTSGGVPGGGTYNYTATNTNSAQQNTVDFMFNATIGQTVAVKICTNIVGDPFLRINRPDGTFAYNDDGCAVQGASHTFVAQLTGAYTIRAGCFSATTCSGTVVWSVQ